ncbi:hypothetical protein [Streptomyces sp. NPDC002580]
MKPLIGRTAPVRYGVRLRRESGAGGEYGERRACRAGREYGE